MKKLDRLILQSFVGPLLLTFFVVVFILLTQMMLNKMQDLVGKNLDFIVFGELMFYFSVKISERALPLAVLLSSLISFGNLGEYSELTAIKSSGISLLRILRPAFFFVLVLTVGAFFNNNYVVTKTNLKAYSLMYDIRKHKPSLDIKAGTFYNGIPDYRIKVNQKYPDGITIGDIIIYDHTGKSGNKIVTLADSGKMYTTPDENYLMFELYDGKRFEEQDNSKSQISNYIRNDFGRSKLVMSLASFDFKQSKEDIWTSHYYMKRINQLSIDIDSMDLNVFDAQLAVYEDAQSTSLYHLKGKVKIPDKYLSRKAFKDSVRKTDNPDSLMAIKYGNDEMERAKQANEKDSLVADSTKMQFAAVKTISISDSIITQQAAKQSAGSGALIGKDRLTLKKGLTNVSKIDADVIKNDKAADLVKKEKNASKNKHKKRKPFTKKQLDSLFQTEKYQTQGIRNALTQARIAKNKLDVQLSKVNNQEKLIIKYKKEIHKKYAQAFACIVMFLIGAPLGAIIKKGGLGVPAIISIVVFIIYYVLSITGEKWADEGYVSPFLGVWGSDLILLPVGLLFLRQAKNDVRLLESDFYRVFFTKIKKRLRLNTA